MTELLRQIHTQHAIPLPCRAAKGFECVFPHLIYTVRPCLIHTCHAASISCSDHAVLLKATAQHSLWATRPRLVSSGYHAEFHEHCYQKHTNPPHNDPYLRL